MEAMAVCEKCSGLGEIHGESCIVRKYIFNQRKGRTFLNSAKAMEQAIKAMEQVRGKSMITETKAVQTQNSSIQLATIERVLIGGDLSQLTPEQRVAYLREVCDSLGLNYMTQPFSYIILNGKLTLYAKKDATEQLRKKHQVSITDIVESESNGIYRVKASARLPDGRTDFAIGAVPISNLKGEQLANAMMKAETKSKRRVTLSICGLGILDETEVDSIPNAQVFDFKQPVNTQEQKVQAPMTHAPEEPKTIVCGQYPDKLATDPERKPSDAQLRRLFAICKQSQVENAQVKAYIFTQFGKQSSKDLSLPEYDYLCDSIVAGELSPRENTETTSGIESGAVETATLSEEKGSLNSNKVSEQELPWNKYLEEQPSMLK